MCAFISLVGTSLSKVLIAAASRPATTKPFSPMGR